MIKPLLDNFNYLKLNICIRLEQDTILPAFKGSMLHGWFGHALMAVDAKVFKIFYGQFSNQQPKPYVISPNSDLKTIWKEKEYFDFDIILFGDAIELAPIVIDACIKGERLGFGINQTKFKVIEVASVTENGLITGIHPQRLSAFIYNNYQSKQLLSPEKTTLRMLTPMRLKYQGKILKNTPPSLDLILKQIVRRVTQISRFWVLDDDEYLGALNNNIPSLQNIDIKDDCYFENWSRFSKKLNKNIPFGGIKGHLNFKGDLSPVYPILKTGELIHIGGKTTFGLGKYILS